MLSTWWLVFAQFVMIAILVVAIRRIGGFLNRAETLLFLVKGWAEIGRDVHKDARRAVNFLESKSDKEPKSDKSLDDVMIAVDKVPDKTAEKVAVAVAGILDHGG